MIRVISLCVFAALGLLSGCQPADESRLANEVTPIANALAKPVTGAAPAPNGSGQKIPDSVIQTKAQASAFLRVAGLGATDSSMTALAGTSAINWVQHQLAMPPRDYRDALAARISDADATSLQVSQLTYETMITTDAELRARMTYALSQLFVINDSDFFNQGYGLAVWMDTLDHNAFGNYRDLMGDVTRSPIMGVFLTFLYNQKGDPETGREPDENYARELLQLFTIGLHELNLDGTVKLGGDGQPIPTYDNEDIVGLARVFTGYVLAGTSQSYNDRFADTWERPMMMIDSRHSAREKTFLGTTIAENTPGETSIDLALDAIFEHPNVAPFVARQLIQRFTASDPEPAYVRRVAEAFETGYFRADDGTRFGNGQRGDLGVTAAAIVLDRSIIDTAREVREGKVREPVLNFVQFARAFAQRPVNAVTTDYTRLAYTSDVTEGLSQGPLRSPSVFNFYRPGYIAPGTETGAAGLTAPELQIVNEGSAIGYMNFMFDFISKTPGHWDPTVMPDYSQIMLLAQDPPALVDHLDLLLVGGRMRVETRDAIEAAVSAMPVRAANIDVDRRSRINIALMMIVVTAEYMSVN